MDATTRLARSLGPGTRLTLVAAPAASAGESAATRLLARRLLEQTGLEAQVSNAVPADASVAVLVGVPAHHPALATALAAAGLAVPESAEGYAVATAAGAILVAGSTARGVLHGAGRLLRQLDSRGGETLVPPLREVSSPVCQERGVYFATHFNNGYERAPLPEVERYIEDLALWGINTLWTWFDMNWHPAGFWDDPHSRGSQMIARLRQINTVARRLGLRVGLTGIANEGFSHQPSAALRAHPGAQRGGFYPHSQICPSAAGGRELILQNRRRVLDLIGPIDAYWYWPYDQGGCGCPQCADANGWGKTFLALGPDIARLVRERNPQADVVLSTWYMNDAELALVQAEANRPDCWFSGVLLETRRAGELRFPAGLSLSVFPEISMFDCYFVSYGCNGANPAPQRFAPEAARIARLGHGAVVYSEGFYEDLNKIIWASVLWDPERTAAEVLSEYCRYYFGAAQESLAAELIVGLEGTWGPTRLAASAAAEPARLFALAERLRERLPGQWRAAVLWHRARLDAMMRALGPERPLLTAAKQIWDEAAFADDGAQVRQRAQELRDAVALRRAGVEALFAAYWEYMRAFHLEQCTLLFRPDPYLGSADLTSLHSACEAALAVQSDDGFREALIQGLHRWLWQSPLGLDFLFL
jgi:hypothetical protein